MASVVMREYAKSVAMVIFFALFAVVGIVQILDSHVLSGILIVGASVVLWAMACSRTDFTDEIGTA